MDSFREIAPSALIFTTVVLGLVFAFIQFSCVAKIKIIGNSGSNSNEEALLPASENPAATDVETRMVEIYNLIRTGAKAFLRAEYFICLGFIAIFGLIVFILVSYQGAGHSSAFDWEFGGLSAISFCVGSLTSILSGYIGMMVAVFSNARTTKEAMRADEKAAWKFSFNAAFRAGGVMGFSLCGLALLMLYLLCLFYYFAYKYDKIDDGDLTPDKNPITMVKVLFESIAGFGLGGSSIALFGRVGGGIYTKAADVGADLAGKVVENLPEDDPRNPAVIADNVGDNVGDVAGMGSDLFGSFGEASCAALVVCSSIPEIVGVGWSALLFPLYISAAGIPVCLITSFFATDLCPVRRAKSVERVLKVQLLVSTLLMTIATWPLAYAFLPKSLHLECDFSDHLKAHCNKTGDACTSLFDTDFDHSNSSSLYSYDVIERLADGGNKLCNQKTESAQMLAALCVCLGLWGGCGIGFITEFYTSASYKPVREVAESTKAGGAATNIIYGLALGYQSVIIPVAILAIAILVSFSLLNMFGVALAALGMLSTLATCLSIDVYGPVCDNAGGIAEMAGCGGEVRKKTNTLDAAGNTTAAIGKGFAIGSAALVSLALFGAFVTRTVILEQQGVNLLRPITFAFLLLGAMLPYWFTAMTMKSVGTAAMAMVSEVDRQFKANPALLDPDSGETPDYAECIAISTNSSLKEMIAPGMLVILSPIITGSIFGIEAVAGLLAGALVSGVQMAISQSNSGGAWDNAKKYVEAGLLLDAEGNVIGKGTEEHKAVVVGDTVGDPLKDTSGPALNILMKLMAIISLVFCDFFIAIGPQLSCAVNLGDQYENVHLSGCGVLGFVMPSTCLQYDLYNHCK